jgi:serine phosphatase RsbU (regulator of sigma subunit)
VFDDLLRDAGADLRAAYAAVDWAATPLGPVAGWSPALRHAVELTSHTHFPVTLLWGPEFVLVYNAAYASLIADKHPMALGARAQDIFPEAWRKIGPMMQAVLDGRGSSSVEDQHLPLVRHGRLDEAYFTYCYSPVRGADGTVEGVLDIATETTRQVLDQRRLTTLSRLRDVVGAAEGVDEVLERALPVLRAADRDLPEVELLPGGSAPPGGETRTRPDGAREMRLPVGARTGGGVPATLVVRLSRHLPEDGAYPAFLRLLALTLGQAIDRIRLLETERAVAETERRMSETLQRSVLTQPVHPDHLEVAVRYLPAAEQAQIGGDWYDAFLDSRGRTTLVVGDVAGHDRLAAAAMAQVRSLLRGIAYASEAAPADVLTALDRAMHGLAPGTYATAVVARVEGVAAGDARHIRWSNAGHPPPVHLGADGGARLLEVPAEPLLGLATGARRDHAFELPAGDTLLLYTDGLVERRPRSLGQGLAWLVERVERGAGLELEALCDFVLGDAGDRADDDVALLALRVRPG